MAEKAKAPVQCKKTATGPEDVSGFQCYLRQCRTYWKIKEQNELLPIPQKTPVPKLPPAFKFLTTKQETILLTLLDQHKHQMQSHVRLSYFHMKYDHTRLSSHKLQMLWQEYNKPDPLDTPCACCQTQDYISHETSIVQPFN